MSGASHTFLFADLAGFTALTEAMGDVEAADLADSFSNQVAALLSDHGAEQIKAIGDAVMLRAEDPAAAILLALCIAHDVGAQHGFLAVRIGLHTGPAVERGGDWFGATVNTAARVAGVAGGGEVLLTESTRVAAGDVERVEFRPRGRHQFKNVAEPVPLYSALRLGEQSAEGLSIDPVCRMVIDPRDCVASITHEGVELTELTHALLHNGPADATEARELVRAWRRIRAGA
jgi:adenylate cyclase